MRRRIRELMFWLTVPTTICSLAPIALPDEAPSSPSLERVSIEKGKPAAFDGVLVTREYFFALVAGGEVEFEKCEVRIKGEREKAGVALVACEKGARVNKDADARLLANCEAHKTRDAEIYEDALKMCTTGPNWWAIGGSYVLGAATCGFSTWAVGK